MNGCTIIELESFLILGLLLGIVEEYRDTKK